MIDYELLRRLRKKKFPKLKDAANSVGMNASHLSDLEHGKKAPSIKTLARLADAYDFELKVLFAKQSKGSKVTHALY